ncbi:hypothetical protein X737_29845 [Mesorhizobium sp. L48C026A00]|nr:hypothetical protein X737_29845 [Mesorhizobium sp. L48C026A00]
MGVMPIITSQIRLHVSMHIQRRSARFVLETRPGVVDATTRAIQILAGLVLVIVAWNAIIAN